MPLVRSVAVTAVCASLGLAAVACGSEEMSSPTPKAPLASTAKKKKHRHKGAVVKVMKSDYGRILFDRRGRALYLFTRDEGERSHCYGACADAWPPFLTRGRPRAKEPADRSLLGTVKRKDGKKQVTYDGHPLYFYVGDREPGQVLCQDVEEYGGHWYVVAPSGKLVR